MLFGQPVPRAFDLANSEDGKGYGHLGADYRERERIKRKRRRWADKIAAMDRLERLAVMDALKAAGGAE